MMGNLSKLMPPSSCWKSVRDGVGFELGKVTSRKGVKGRTEKTD